MAGYKGTGDKVDNEAFKNMKNKTKKKSDNLAKTKYQKMYVFIVKNQLYLTCRIFSIFSRF